MRFDDSTEYASIFFQRRETPFIMFVFCGENIHKSMDDIRNKVVIHSFYGN